MKKRAWSRALMVLVVLASASVFADGSERFSPTKLQWLAMELRAAASADGSGLSVVFIEKPPNTIVVRALVFRADIALALVNLALDTHEAMARDMADSYGWKWLVVEREVKNTKYVLPPRRESAVRSQ